MPYELAAHSSGLKMKRIFFALAATTCLASAAQAGTIASGSTLLSGGGINPDNGRLIESDNEKWYSKEETSIESEWVWIDNILTTDTARFNFEFDLTGWELSTVHLSGLWGVDNFGSVELNGEVIASWGKPASIESFSSLTQYSASSGFNAGVNHLVFSLQDSGEHERDQAAFRATALVTGQKRPISVSSAQETMAPVPLPAGLVLLLSGLGALVGIGRLRRF